MENSGSTMAWWWRLRFSGRASPSTTEEEEMYEGREGLRQGKACHCPLSPSLYIGGRGGEEAP